MVGDYMYILFNWCDQQGVTKIISIINSLLNIVRYIVPIGLIVMTTIDIFKKVINPDDKDGQKKILNRIIAGLIVFFVPTMIRFVLKVARVGGENFGGSSSNSLHCLWELVE